MLASTWHGRGHGDVPSCDAQLGKHRVKVFRIPRQRWQPPLRGLSRPIDEQDARRKDTEISVMPVSGVTLLVIGVHLMIGYRDGDVCARRGVRLDSHLLRGVRAVGHRESPRAPSGALSLSPLRRRNVDLSSPSPLPPPLPRFRQPARLAVVEDNLDPS